MLQRVNWEKDLKKIDGNYENIALIGDLFLQVHFL
jgi:hypothetical protein